MKRRRLLSVLVALAGAGVALALALVWWTRGPGLGRSTARLAELVELRPGMTLAEIGAGRGLMAVRVAALLGSQGRLFVTEISERHIEALRAAAATLPQMTVVRGQENSTSLAEACCEVIYLRRVYHHLTCPAAMNRSMHSALRPGGRLAVIELVTPRWMFFSQHGAAPERLIAELTAAGFQLEKRIDGWSAIDYCLLFRKP